MNEKQRESLSAMMDGEVSELEMRRLVQEMGKDPEMAEHWQRLHVTRSLMREEENLVLDMDIASRVSEAIGVEPAHEPACDVSEATIAPSSTEKSHPLQAFWQPIASIAVAATVAFAIVMGWQQYHHPAGSYAPVLADNEAAISSPGASAVAPVSSHIVKGVLGQPQVASVSARTPISSGAPLNDYVVRHLGQSASRTHGAMTSYARVVILPARPVSAQTAKQSVDDQPETAGAARR